MSLHPDLIDVAWKMKIAYMDWQENLGCRDDVHDFYRDFDHARQNFRIVKKRLEDAGIPTGLDNI